MRSHRCRPPLRTALTAARGRSPPRGIVAARSAPPAATPATTQAILERGLCRKWQRRRQVRRQRLVVTPYTRPCVRRAHARRAYAHWSTHPVRRLFVVADDGSPSGADELRVRGVVEHAGRGGVLLSGFVRSEWSLYVELVLFRGFPRASEGVVGSLDRAVKGG